jgi:hypothetical protein
MAVNCDLRGVQDDVTAVAASDGEMQCSKVRSDGVRDGPSLRSQAVTRSAVYPSLSSDGHPPSISLPRAQELPRLILSLHFFTSTLHTHYPLFT